MGLIKLIIISAVAKNRVIGNRGEMPWKISDDFKRFKRLTEGYPVIMGRKTYESLPTRFRPLPNRTNIILSGNFQAENESIRVCKNPDQALLQAQETAKKDGKDKIYVIGGAEVYRLYFPLSDVLEITHIDKEFEGDAHFPEIKKDEWEIRNKENHQTQDGLKYSFVTYERKSDYNQGS